MYSFDFTTLIYSVVIFFYKKQYCERRDEIFNMEYVLYSVNQLFYCFHFFIALQNETDEEREVKQFHFTVWPDNGVPEYPTALLAFQRRVRAYNSRDCGPLAVHCR